MPGTAQDAYVEHLINRLGNSNRVLDELVSAIEERVGIDVIAGDRKWDRVRQAILAEMSATGPAMSQVRFEMTTGF